MAVGFGRYQLLRKIASGGMGQVFLARTGTAGIEKTLVIKRILPSLGEDEEFVEMFFDEAKLASRLNHQNLIQIFDMGQVEGVPYLAMEYVQGEDLRRLEKAARQAGTPLPLGLLIRILADAAAGLAYAHSVRDDKGQPLGLVHRDVSPQNILVGFDGAVKLIDFGVAKAAGRSQRTATGVLKGKYAYMSPEQADGRPLDGRSDIFALGIILWEVLTTRRLFKGENDLETLRLVKDCAVPPPSRLNPEVPPELEAIVLKCLAARPEDRYPDAGALRLALEDVAIQRRLPASSAHLADFLKRLFSDRIQRELLTPETLDELSASVDLDARSASKSTKGNLSSLGAAGAGEAKGNASPGNKGAQSGALLAAGAAAAVLTLGGGLLAFTRAQRPPSLPEPQPVQVLVPVPAQPAPPQPPALPQARPPEPVTPSEQALPATVPVMVESVPAGATVSAGGEVLGLTPLALELMREGTARPMELKLAGHEPLTVMVSAQNAPRLTVALQPKREAPRPPRPPPPDLGIKTGR